MSMMESPEFYDRVKRFLNFAPAGLSTLAEREEHMIATLRQLALSPGFKALLDILEGELRLCWQVWLDPETDEKATDAARYRALTLASVLEACQGAVSQEPAEVHLDRAMRGGTVDAVLADDWVSQQNPMHNHDLGPYDE